MASTMLSSSSKQKTNYALGVSYIVKELIESYESGATLNLTKLKGDAAKKFGLQGYVLLFGSSVCSTSKKFLNDERKKKNVRKKY